MNKGQLAINLAVSRQTLSYSGAYCIALLLFLNFNHSSLSLPILLKYTFWKWINWGLVVLDLYIVFAGAGRGAFVLSGVILIYFVFTQIKTMDFMKIAEVAALIFIAFAGIVYASKSSSISSGFQAIESLFLNGFTDRSSTERLDFYYEAYEYAKNNYFIGGGTCTVEYVLGNYSHNMFMDILVDFGLIGVLFALYKFGGIVCKGMRLADKHSYFQMLFIMFLCGFIGLQFSGSWLAETALWFPFSAIYLYIEKNRKTQEIILQI